jgi:RNA polymerase sigma factor (sigma-70 family)
MSVDVQALSDAGRLRNLRRLVPRSDEALCAMAARGDASAFGAIYERHHAGLYRYCRSILGHDEDAFDAVHNTMLKAWEALLRVEPTAPLRPWLFRIAHNEAISVLRRRREHGQLDEAHQAATVSLDETLETRRRLAGLRADLEALPERQRSALLLRELCGLRHNEIAAVLEISAATARQTIHEARLALHEAETGRQMACAAVRRALSDGDGRVRRARKLRGHVRTCAACGSFEEALRRRPGRLTALAPPLPAAASVGLLNRLLCGAGASGAGSSAVGGAMTAHVAGATTAISNLAATIAATAAVGTIVATGVGGVLAGEHAAAPSAAGATSATAAGGRDSAGLAVQPRSAAPQGANGAPAARVPSTDRPGPPLATAAPGNAATQSRESAAATAGPAPSGDGAGVDRPQAGVPGSPPADVVARPSEQRPQAAPRESSPGPSRRPIGEASERRSRPSSGPSGSSYGEDSPRTAPRAAEGPGRASPEDPARLPRTGRAGSAPEPPAERSSGGPTDGSDAPSGRPVSAHAEGLRSFAEEASNRP